MNKYVSSIITGIILLFFMSLLVLPKDSFSHIENRKLQEWPELKADNILDGGYSRDITAYINDHFPFRDKFITVKTNFEKNVLRSKLINNVYICKDDFYIENYKAAANSKRIINTLNNFVSNTNVDVDLIIVPTASTIYNDKLPRFAQLPSQLDDIYNIYDNVLCKSIDVYSVLMQNRDKENLFYKLDHHWTTEGAYYAYLEFCKVKGFEPISMDKTNLDIVTTDFRGTIYSKLNDTMLQGEEIKIYKPDLELNILYDGEESDSLYNFDYLENKDKYSLFLNNIKSFVEISSSINADRSIAIAKDSYANCFIPFLVNHYNKIYVFDTRSYKGAISDFVKANNIDDVLVLYNMNTLDNDTGINVIY